MKREVYADLHIHTENSDGKMSFQDLVNISKKKNSIGAIAVTDHDILNSNIEEKYINKKGVTIINGIELRVEMNNQRVDLLGYGVEETYELEKELDRIQKARKERGEKVLEKVKEYFGVELNYEPNRHTGRPDIARAIEDSSQIDHTYQEAFDHVIGQDCPCYVQRYVPSFEKGKNLLSEASEVVSLAHPFRYDNVSKALDKAETLDAIELYYPYDKNDSRIVRRYIDEYDLIATGGSDSHNYQIAKQGLTREESKTFLGKLGIQLI